MMKKNIFLNCPWKPRNMKLEKIKIIEDQIQQSFTKFPIFNPTSNFERLSKKTEGRY
jgi:hypothetical protein